MSWNRIAIFFTAALLLVGAKAEMNATLLAKAGKAYKALHADINWQVVQEASFETKIDSNLKTKNIFLAMVTSDARGDFGLAILDSKGEEILVDLPKSESAVGGIFSFHRFEAVSFEDVNSDGIQDLFVIVSYSDSRSMQGDGVGEGRLEYVDLAYLSHSGLKFELFEGCDEYNKISSFKTCVAKKLKVAN